MSYLLSLCMLVVFCVIQVYYMYEVPGVLTVILITIWWLQKLGKDWQ